MTFSAEPNRPGRPWRSGAFAVVRRGGRGCRAGVAGGLCLAAAVWAAGMPFATRAQETSELITTALPFPEYYPVQDDHYGHRIGKVNMHYGASVATVFTDNRNLTSDNQEADFGVTTSVNLGGFYVINERQKVQLDVGIGYAWWLESNERDGLFITPSSHLDYYFRVGDVQINLANETSTSMNASDRPEYAGGSGNSAQDLAFHEMRNISTASSSYALNRSVSAGGSYSFTLTRSLTEQFQSLDSNRHQFSVGPNWQVSAPVSVGLSGSYQLIQYEQQVQNDGELVSFGGDVSWRARDNLSISLSAGYSQSFYDQTGTIQDNSNFGGPTFSMSIAHEMNKYMRHTLSASRGMEAGFGSNYTDSFNVQYMLNVRMARLSPTLTVNYNNFSQSGSGGESGGLYRITLSNGFQLTRRVNLGAAYNANIRASGDADRDYLENQVTATLLVSF